MSKNLLPPNPPSSDARPTSTSSQWESSSVGGRAATARRFRIGAFAVVALAITGCASSSEKAVVSHVVTAPTSVVSTTVTASTTTTTIRQPAATLPNAAGVSVLGPGLDGQAISKRVSPGVFSVLSRSCAAGRFATSSGFAVDPRFILTARAAVAENPGDPLSAIDPEPWVRSVNGEWRQTDTVAIDGTNGLAMLRVKDPYSNLPSTLTWATGAVSEPKLGAIVGFPGVQDGSFRVLAVTYDPAAIDGTVGYSMVVPSESGLGLLGAPVVDASGNVVAVNLNMDADNSKATGSGIAADLASAATVALASRQEAVAGECDEAATGRLPLAWGAVLDSTGSTSRAAELAALSGMSGLGRIGAVDQRWVSFLPPRSVGPVILGPFESEREARDALDDADQIMVRAKQPSPIGVSLFPMAAFDPAPVPPAYTTLTMPPSTTAPPTTKRRPTTTTKKSTTTTKKGATTTTAKTGSATSGACPPEGKRYLATIANGGSGMSVIFRAGPSPSAAGVAKAANGYQVSVVRGSSTNGFSQIVLPESPPRCAWVPNKNLG
jgi:hypothetical protein